MLRHIGKGTPRMGVVQSGKKGIIGRRYREDDYRYAAAKASALSCRLIPPDKLEGLLDATTADEVFLRLTEYGFSAANGDAEQELSGYLAERYDNLLSFCPNSSLALICRLRYDCNNLKSAIKCRYIEKDVLPFIICTGYMSADDIVSAVELSDFSVMPKFMSNMARGAEMAQKALTESGNARTVDSLLDRACFADMRAAAADCGMKEVALLLEQKTDHTNIMTRLRLLRLRDRELAEAVYDDAVISGGKIDIKALRDAEDIDTVALLAEKAGYLFIARSVYKYGKKDIGLDALSLIFDNDFVDTVHEMTSYKLLGAYPLIAYIIALEYEIKDLRIIISGIEAKNSIDTIRERLRNYYV